VSARPSTAARADDAAREELLDGLARWMTDPRAFVRECLGAEPDAWQGLALDAVVRRPRVAMSACKGPGKSALLAWVALWFLATRPDAQIIVTSITQPNLRDNLWKEMAVWYAKSAFLQGAFEFKGERVSSRERPKTWWISARSWAHDADPTQQANTLAGFHGKRVMVLLDEVGDYPDGVVVAAEGIFANEEIEAHLVVAGNPTRTDGPLYRITTRDRGKWDVIYITGDPDDPNRSPRISRPWAQEQIEAWGRDHDWVRVNILGQFPRVGNNRLLGPDDLNVAEQRSCREADYRTEPIIFGLDVARDGGDRSVLYKRQGCVAFRPWVWRGKDGPELADVVAGILRSEGDYDYIVVDKGGPGYSVWDHLKLLGFKDVMIGIDFGGSPIDQRYANRGTEAWVDCARWVRERGCLPGGDGELAAELTTRSYLFKVLNKRTVQILESKDELKKRGRPSPDKGDALALTFAAPLGPRPRRSPFQGLGRADGLPENSYWRDADNVLGNDG
jgi:phage terminase large subunit